MGVLGSPGRAELKVISSGKGPGLPGSHPDSRKTKRFKRNAKNKTHLFMDKGMLNDNFQIVVKAGADMFVNVGLGKH